MAGSEVVGVRIGSLCSGYGGLDMAVESVFGGELAWVSDIDKGACKILAHRYPSVPNIGDMTSVDWADVEPVDVICGGTPCQDLSHAGKRAGMTEGTRSNLWVAMREAIAVIRPKYVVWENVRGAASAEADSDLEQRPGLLAGVRRRPGQPLLRALGRVVGDLSDLGYVGQVRGLRAADVGSCHGRFRYFILATDAERGGRDGWAPIAGRGSVERVAAQGPGEGTLLPTPATTRDHKGRNQRDDSTCLTGALLPTPAVNDMGEGKTVEAWDAWTERMKAEHGNGNGHGASLSIEAQRLLPTPRTENNENRQSEGYGGQDGNFYGLVNGLTDWGQYAVAIHRWESLTRPAPAPTEIGPKGSPRLAAAFSEWMMGLPAGWVTDVPGITRNEALRALGNGVVPQQATTALVEMASWEVAA